MVLGEVCPVLVLSCVIHCIYLCEDCPPVCSVRGLSYSRTQSTSVYGICKCSIGTDSFNIWGSAPGVAYLWVYIQGALGACVENLLEKCVWLRGLNVCKYI